MGLAPVDCDASGRDRRILGIAKIDRVSGNVANAHKEIAQIARNHGFRAGAHALSLPTVLLPSVSPKILEAIGGQFGVPGRVLNILVTKVML